MDLTIGSHHFKLSLALLAGAGVALFLFLHFGGSSVALETWLASGRQEIQATRTLLARDQRHAREAAQARTQARELGQQGAAAAAKFAALADSFRAHLVADAHATPEQTADFLRVSQACFDALTLCKARGDSLQHADSVSDARADTLQAALLRADTTLARGVRLVECHLIHAGPIKLFGCPSRVGAFEWGAALGSLVTLVLTHR